MNVKLTVAEKRFLDEVFTELTQYQISATDRRGVKQHQESRESEQDSISQLGNPSVFVKDF